MALHFSLPRRVDHSRITRKVIKYGGRYQHVAKVRGPEDVDDLLCSFLPEAYLNSPV